MRAGAVFPPALHPWQVSLRPTGCWRRRAGAGEGLGRDPRVGTQFWSSWGCCLPRALLEGTGASCFSVFTGVTSHTDIDTHMHIDTHHTQTHTYTQTHTHTHKHIHTKKKTHTHKHKHIHTSLTGPSKLEEGRQLKLKAEGSCFHKILFFRC